MIPTKDSWHKRSFDVPGASVDHFEAHLVGRNRACRARHSAIGGAYAGTHHPILLPSGGLDCRRASRESSTSTPHRPRLIKGNHVPTFIHILRRAPSADPRCLLASRHPEPVGAVRMPGQKSDPQPSTPAHLPSAAPPACDCGKGTPAIPQPLTSATGAYHASVRGDCYQLQRPTTVTTSPLSAATSRTTRSSSMHLSSAATTPDRRTKSGRDEIRLMFEYWRRGKPVSRLRPD